MWFEKITGSLEQKKQYKQLVARLDALPEPYLAAATAMNRYLMRSGGIGDGELLVRMFGDFVELWERAAADGTSIRSLVGDDPAAFAEDFVRSYAGRQWIDTERERFAAAIADAEKGQQR